MSGRGLLDSCHSCREKILELVDVIVLVLLGHIEVVFLAKLMVVFLP